MSTQLARGRARRSVATVAEPVRCAIYTRKSTDEGLDRDFNSLDAQREACEAYVTSQRHEGWAATGERFDDGGFSGGNTDRPALQRLLGAVEARAVDVIVVYKLDRLSRSLLDFLKLHEFLEAYGVGLVSVTQAINTSTPHGRMMVNVLLSFAQYEREVIAERTSDKLSAARRRGKWTGGMQVLGYDVAPEGGRLVVNEPEAEQVRAIFALYQAERSLVKVANELNRRGWRRKSWTTREGRIRVGKTWDKTNLHKLLVNPIYAGLQRLGDDTFPGEHPAIVPLPLFRKVQGLLAGNRCSGSQNRNEGGALLRGLLRCTACDAPMIHSWTRKGGRAYRYYVCTRAQKNGAAACPTRSVRADAIEQVVVDRIRGIGNDRGLQRAVVAEAGRQARADRDALTAERKRLDADTRTAKTEIAGLAASIARTGGLAADALVAALGAAQQRVNDLTGRLAEIDTHLAGLDTRRLDEDDLRRALEAFDPIWEALLTPERERIVQLLVERVGYDGRTEELEVRFQPAGIASLADETAPTVEE